MMAIMQQEQPCRFFLITTLVQLLQTAKASYQLPTMLRRLDRYVSL